MQQCSNEAMEQWLHICPLGEPEGRPTGNQITRSLPVSGRPPASQPARRNWKAAQLQLLIRLAAVCVPQPGRPETLGRPTGDSLRPSWRQSAAHEEPMVEAGPQSKVPRAASGAMDQNRSMRKRRQVEACRRASLFQDHTETERQSAGLSGRSSGGCTCEAKLARSVWPAACCCGPRASGRVSAHCLGPAECVSNAVQCSSVQLSAVECSGSRQRAASVCSAAFHAAGAQTEIGRQR